MKDITQIIEDFQRRLAAMTDEELRAAADEAYEQSRILKEIMEENEE